MSQSRSSSSNRLLGYPDDARLLIINADDFGMYPDVNEGIIRSIKEGVVRSTSLMVPWPSALDGMAWFKENPEVSFAVHLSVICDLDNFKWSPLTAKEKVPSLVDESGKFYSLKRERELLAQAKLDELEIEFRAQIEKVIDAGLKPTHLDWHCLHNGGRTDIFDLTFRLAREYGLALRVADPYLSEKLQAQGLPTVEYDLLDSFSMKLDDKSAHYIRLLRELPAGLSEWAVHPSIGSVESQAMDDGWQVRRTDFDFVMSPEAQDIIREEGIILLDYKSLQAAWQAIQPH